MVFNFVVNGNDCVVHAHPADSLRMLVNIAFTCTRYKRRDQRGEDRGWEVRDNAGRLLDESVVASTLDYTQDAIFINLPAGSGA